MFRDGDVLLFWFNPTLLCSVWPYKWNSLYFIKNWKRCSWTYYWKHAHAIKTNENPESWSL